MPRVIVMPDLWAIYRMSQGKKRSSALHLSKEIGVSYPTASNFKQLPLGTHHSTVSQSTPRKCGKKCHQS